MFSKGIKNIVPIILIAFLGCSKRNDGPPPSLPAHVANAFAPEVPTVSDEDKDRAKASADSTSLLEAEKYDELETVAAKLRTEDYRYPDGDSRLRCFYDGLSELDETNSDELWNARVAVLDKWVKERPESITACVALADIWINFAWKARGHEYADSVTHEGARLFQQRTLSAADVLKKAASLQAKCPYSWSVAMRVALNDGWPRSDYEKLFAEAVKANPGFFEYDFEKMNYLLPRWYGEEGDWEAFITSTADQIGGDEGDVFYARMIWRMLHRQVYHHIYKDAKLEWPRAKRGFDQLRKRYPGSLEASSEYCLEAGVNEDKEKMKELFVELDGRVDLNIWLDQGRFEAFRDWAYDK